MHPLEADDPAAIGPYRLLGVLGTGGMGRVYLGRNPGGRTVAVKVIRPELAGTPEFRSRFRRELAAARRVTGPGTVPVLDADPDAPRPWLATAYVAGPSLQEVVKAFGPLPESALGPLAAGLARALTTVHRGGVVHRDLKPSNVLLTVDGPQLIDFGIARAADDDSSVTTTGHVIGSPGYMAPEHIAGNNAVGPPGDVFALGSVLVFAATGNGPFGSADSIALLWRIMQEPARLDAVPPAWRPLVAACLNKDPLHRPTPADIEQRSSELDTAGSVWLPAPVLQEISRQTMALLDLESTPVPPLDIHTGHAPTLGTQPTAGTDPPAPPEYRVPSRRPRPRRRTLVIGAGIALVLAAAAISTTLTFRHASHGPSAATLSADTTTAAASSTLPTDYIGTWKGTATDGLATFDIVVTLDTGSLGTEVGTSSNTGRASGTTCRRAETFTAATESTLTLRACLRSGAGCLDDGQSSTLTLDPGGTLSYTMAGPVGAITGTLHKQ